MEEIRFHEVLVDGEATLLFKETPYHSLMITGPRSWRAQVETPPAVEMYRSSPNGLSTLAP